MYRWVVTQPRLSCCLLLIYNMHTCSTVHCIEIDGTEHDVFSPYQKPPTRFFTFFFVPPARPPNLPGST